MRPLIRKLFSLHDLKYGWLLALSIFICAATFYADRVIDPEDQFWLSAAYGLSFGIAVLWGAVNYIAHMHLNRLYRKGEDIPAYVAQLALSEEDKQELQNYLEDYAEDLRSQGRTQEEAAREAVSQFRVQELLSLSKNSLLFELHAHYYLLGWSLTAVAAFAGLALIGWMTFPHSLLLLLAETILAAYGFGMAFLFVLYKALDALLYRKLKEHLSD